MTQTSAATAIVGLGVSGLSCLRYLHGREPLVVVDSRSEPPMLAAARAAFPEVEFRLGQAPADWHGIERLVLSPGVAVDDHLLDGSEGLPRTSDIDLFVAAADAPIIGITGTNGKSTVTALVGHILANLGVRAAIGGNLGEPALELLAEAPEVYVLELSSFQLEHAAPLPLAAAAVLNVSPDHLDRHGTLEQYAALKRRIFSRAGACVFNADDSATTPRSVERLASDEGLRCSFGTDGAADFQLQDGVSGPQFALPAGQVDALTAGSFAGRHNQLNLLAALALVAAARLPQLAGNAVAAERYVEAAADFGGLAHRCEVVAERAGVTFVNDSKATNVGACIAALDGLSGCATRRRILLLAGGVGKGADFSPLATAVQQHVKQALLFGVDAQLLEDALVGAAPVAQYPTLDAAVTAAAQAAETGDVVLLAPACASFDMFDNFEARGTAFRQLVEALA